MRKKTPRYPTPTTPEGKAIVHELRAQGMTIYRLGKLTGLNNGSLHDMLAGAYRPKLSKVARIARALDVSIIDLRPGARR